MVTRIAVIRRFPEEILDMLRAYGEVIDNQAGVALDAAGLARHLAGADAVLVTALDRIDADLIAACPQLRVIANIGVGYNNIDIDACNRHGVLATNTPGSVDNATADYAFALMLAAARQVLANDSFVRNRQWGAAVSPLLGLDVHHRVLGIVGLGRIGKLVARRASGFEMDVRYCNRHPLPAAEEAVLGVRFQDLPAMLREVDFLVLQVPYSAATHHLIGADQLASMKKTAVLVNTARGGVVDDAALAEALRSHVIAAAGLDVFENEPALNPEFLGLDNVVLAPHAGSATGATRLAMMQQAASNLIAALSGMPPNPINPQVRGR